MFHSYVIKQLSTVSKLHDIVECSFLFPLVKNFTKIDQETRDYFTEHRVVKHKFQLDAFSSWTFGRPLS